MGLENCNFGISYPNTMSTNRKTQSDKHSLSGFDKLERFHPYKTFLFFGIVGSTVLFLSVVFLYFLTVSRMGTAENFVIPKAFSVSTVFLLLSSYSISGAVKAFRNDSFRNLKASLTGTILLTVIFCVAQVFGWQKMIEAGFYLDTNPGIAYLYILSGLHLLHVVGGLLYVSAVTFSVFNKSTDIVKSLLYFTDELQATRLQLITAYWHFIDALWVLLFFMFLFTF